MTLSSKDEKTLAGTCDQYGVTTPISFLKVSEIPEYGEFYESYDSEALERIELLREYNEYADDTSTIPFTYKLYQREENEVIIEKYGLDALTEGYSDVELMTILLNWVCDNVKHDGSVALPAQRDTASLIEYAAENQGINCRGVSIILADLCRIYGIEAKHITCMPKEPDFEDCHVVVIAFSRELNQWIMLDPSFRVILKNEDGNYMDLQMLRQSYIDDTEIIVNEDASHNGDYLDFFWYKGYMAKNVFRFSSGTDFYSGNDSENLTLIPMGYENNITTSSQEFWAIPVK